MRLMEQWKAQRLAQQDREQAAKRRAAEQAEEETRRKAWEATDHGRAQLAFDAGDRFFQVQRVISKTRGQPSR